MTRQTWTAFVSALAFVSLAVVLAVVPVPFVTWSPGGTRDTLGAVGSEPIISIDGIKTYPTSGRLDLTTVSVTRADSRLSLPEAVAAFFLPHRDALPRDSVYDRTKSAEQVETEEAEMMETAQDDAIVAALRAANQPVTPMPAVGSVVVGGPAHNVLLPGDLIMAVGGTDTPNADTVRAAIRKHRIGDTVSFEVWRQRAKHKVEVKTSESTSQPGVPIVGIDITTGYRYEPRISFDFGQQIGGPSAGLVFGLAIYDKITEGELLEGRHVAGTGGITPTGAVQPIGGLQEKIAAAEKDGATVFLVPAANCDNLVGVDTDMSLIRVADLTEGINALNTLREPDGESRVPRC